jgi:hypothetical protein
MPLRLGCFAGYLEPLFYSFVGFSARVFPPFLPPRRVMVCVVCYGLRGYSWEPSFRHTLFCNFATTTQALQALQLLRHLARVIKLDGGRH